MKITGYESTILNITEDDPLANMPEESGRKRPIVILRMRTDAGIEGIGVTLWGGRLTRSLQAAVDDLAALTVGEVRCASKGSLRGCATPPDRPAGRAASSP